MAGVAENVIVTDKMCACSAIHTHEVHHREFPEVHVEGLTPGDAAEHLLDRLTSVLDSVPNHQHREAVQRAIDDVHAFVEKNPPTGVLEVVPETPRTIEECFAFDIRPLGPAIHEARSAPLIKTEGLEVIRLIVRKGKELPSHKARGEATIQCLEGKAEFSKGGTTHTLLPGQLIHLKQGEAHSLLALEDTSLLVTILHP